MVLICCVDGEVDIYCILYTQQDANNKGYPILSVFIYSAFLIICGNGGEKWHM
jgi:hypothetical protein